MILCIIGIIWFITLFVDINRYIFAMQKFWKKDGKYSLRNMNYTALLNYNSYYRHRNRLMHFYTSFLYQTFHSSWVSKYRINRRRRWRAIDKYSNKWSTSKNTSILRIFQRTTFGFIFPKNWRRYLLCYAYSTFDPPNGERGIKNY